MFAMNNHVTRSGLYGLLSLLRLLSLELWHTFFKINNSKSTLIKDKMENRNEIVDEVNKLIEINNDRIEGYERAVKETNDESLKSRFTNYALQSRKFKSELTGFVTANGGKPTEGTTTSGKFFRAWMDFKSAIALK